MSFLQELENNFHSMLDLRSSLGYATATDKSTLPPFISFCGSNYTSAKSITKEMVDEWLVRHPYKNAKTQAVFITLLRRYTKFMKSLGKDTFIPNEEYTVRCERYQPYIFDEKELSSLFQSMDTIHPYHNSPKREIIIPVLFRMMYCCGMRPSEPLRLHIKDVDLKSGDIYIRQSKKNRDRHIIMSEDMRHLCVKYNTLAGEREWFFQKLDGSPLSTQWMRKQFNICWKRSGLIKRGNPRPFDLRHVFATMNMMRWVDEGKEVMDLLPYLGTYMGHRHFTSTLYYIHLLPERLRKSAGINWEQFSSIFREGDSDDES